MPKVFPIPTGGDCHVHVFPRPDENAAIIQFRRQQGRIEIKTNMEFNPDQTEKRWDTTLAELEKTEKTITEQKSDNILPEQITAIKALNNLKRYATGLPIKDKSFEIIGAHPKNEDLAYLYKNKFNKRAFVRIFLDPKWKSASVEELIEMEDKMNKAYKNVPSFSVDIKEIPSTKVFFSGNFFSTTVYDKYKDERRILVGKFIGEPEPDFSRISVSVKETDYKEYIKQQNPGHFESGFPFEETLARYHWDFVDIDSESFNKDQENKYMDNPMDQMLYDAVRDFRSKEDSSYTPGSRKEWAKPENWDIKENTDEHRKLEEYNTIRYKDVENRRQETKHLDSGNEKHRRTDPVRTL